MKIFAACFLLVAWQSADDWSRLRPAYERLEAGDAAGAVEQFTKFLDDDHLPRHLRFEALERRASARLALDEPAMAIEDFTAAIELAPNEPVLYLGRASAYRRQGERSLASADEATAAELFDNASEDSAGYYGGNPWTHLRKWACLFLFAVWFVVAVIYLAAGYKQRKAGGGSVLRWFWVSAVAAALAVLPLAVWAILGGCLSLETFSFGAALLVTIISAFSVSLSLSPPGKIPGVKRSLPFADNAEFVARVDELAGRMRISTPQVQVAKTIGALAAQAGAGGLPAPSLVVTDGVMHRLARDERDVVVAHELAHLANGSLWLLPITGSIACTAAVLFGGDGPAWLGFGAALFVGLRRLVSRPDELRCDRRAAEVIGHAEMASALEKLEAINPVARWPWLTAVIYATATHPSLPIRRAALARHAPAERQGEIAFSPSTARRHRWFSSAAFCFWGAAVATGTILTHWANRPHQAFAIFAAVAIGPWALCLLALWDNWRSFRRLTRSTTTWRRALRWALAALAVVLIFDELLVGFPLELPIQGISLPIRPIALLVLLIAISWPDRTRDLLKEVRVALQQHEFERVLELGRSKPAVVARSVPLRHNVALAAALAGDRQRAMAEFEQLRRDAPGFKLSGLMLSALYLDEGRPEQALAVAEEIRMELPHECAPAMLAAFALHGLGRLDEAQDAVERALALEPKAGDGYALAGRIALDRGDVCRAQDLIERAHRLSPGGSYVLSVQARLALTTAAASARQMVEEAVEAIRANPFLLLSREATALEEKLANL
ncbi:MAG: M48 family metalloprotease [Rhodopirellula sp.]|nr:M48 family metalloprotease [Rhodopirellula sp.]